MRWNRELRINGTVNSQIFHAEEMAENDWRWSGVDWTGICKGGWEQMISAAAFQIAKTDFVTLTLPGEPGQPPFLDMAKNAWVAGKYLAPHEYLPVLIPYERRPGS